MMAFLTLAHVGHWAASLLYLAPVVLVLAALGWQSLKDRRKRPGRRRGDGRPPRSG